jgi:hypothetical protein
MEEDVPMTRFPPALVGLLLLAGSTWAQTPSCSAPQSGDLPIIHRKADAIRMLLPELMEECEQAISAGDLHKAELLAKFAHELAPDSRLTVGMAALVLKASFPQESCVRPCYRRVKTSGLESTGKETQCNCGEKCCCEPGHCECGEKCRENCACRAKTVRGPEVLPAPDEVQADSIAVSQPCEHSEPIATDAPRVQIKLQGIEASADRMSVVTNPGEQSKILLEGNVEINLTQPGQPARILTGRALIDPEDGSYEVMPVHFTPRNIKPTSYIVPSTPMERGWR